MRIHQLTVLSVVIVSVAVLVAACGGSDSEPVDTPVGLDVSTSAEDAKYFAEVRAAQEKAESNFSNFGEIFGQTWPVRSALISALLEAGVGTAFVENLEALTQIQAPMHLQDSHIKLVDSVQQLADLDLKAAEEIEKEDLAAFVLINGQMVELTVSTFIELPGAFCNGIHPAGSPVSPVCSLTEPVPGGEYGAQLYQLMREFQPKFVNAMGSMGFPLSLSEEELILVFSAIVPEVESRLAATREMLGTLTPPSEYSDDHRLLIGYFSDMADGFSQISEAAIAGELGEMSAQLSNSATIFCEARSSFLSSEFKSLVGIHFDGPNPCDEESS